MRKAIVILVCLSLSLLVLSVNASDLKITSEPENARVLFQGQDVGKTPLTLHDVKPGEKTIEISKAGYETISETLNVQPDVNVKNFILKAVGGVIRINSIPTDADVTLDGKKLEAKTPVTLVVKPGIHTIMIEAAKYEAATQKVQTDLGDEVELQFVLHGPPGISLPSVTYTVMETTCTMDDEGKPVCSTRPEKQTIDYSAGTSYENPDGSYTVGITSLPEGATVTIDGKERKHKTPGLYSVNSGDTQVLISLEGYDSYDEEINFPGESPLVVTLYPSTKTQASNIGNTENTEDGTKGAKLTLKSEPDQATVLIDGKIAGETPFTAGFGPRVVQITLKKDGYKQKIISVDFSDGKDQNLNIRLVKI